MAPCLSVATTSTGSPSFAFVSSAGSSWSGPIRVIGSDQNEYFVKCLEACPDDLQRKSLVIEQVVAEVGKLIGAPVCETSLIRVPEELAGLRVRSGMSLATGLARASRALDRADEYGRPSLYARHRDDNRRRHVGIYALFDWCMGSDQQWLYDLDEDRTIYSHDHGLYLPPTGFGFYTIDALKAEVSSPSTLPDAPSGLDAGAIEQVAKALEAVSRGNLIRVLNHVPASWPATDEELEALGWFLERRAPAVATRLRDLCSKAGASR